MKFVDDIPVFEEIIHHLIACLYLLFVLQRQRDPAAQETRTHWRDSLVDDVNKRFSVRIRGVQKFQITYRELVEPHKLPLVDSRKRGDIIYLIVLGLMQIMYSSTSRHDAFWKIVNAEAFQRSGVEMPCQDVVGIIIGEDPVVEHGEEILIAESLDKITAFVTLAQHFRRVEAL